MGQSPLKLKAFELSNVQWKQQIEGFQMLTEAYILRDADDKAYKAR